MRVSSFISHIYALLRVIIKTWPIIKFNMLSMTQFQKVVDFLKKYIYHKNYMISSVRIQGFALQSEMPLKLLTRTKDSNNTL